MYALKHASILTSSGKKRCKPNFKNRIFRIKNGNVENGRRLNHFRSVLEFGIMYFIPNSNLSENTNSSVSNVENDAGRYGIYSDNFHP